MYLKVGNETAALQAFQQSLSILENLLEPDHPALAYPLASFGGINLQPDQVGPAAFYLSAPTSYVQVLYPRITGYWTNF